MQNTRCQASRVEESVKKTVLRLKKPKTPAAFASVFMQYKKYDSYDKTADKYKDALAAPSTCVHRCVYTGVCTQVCVHMPVGVCAQACVHRFVNTHTNTQKPKEGSGWAEFILCLQV
jgi:hypothetical protein